MTGLPAQVAAGAMDLNETAEALSQRGRGGRGLDCQESFLIEGNSDEENLVYMEKKNFFNDNNCPADSGSFL